MIKNINEIIADDFYKEFCEKQEITSLYIYTSSVNDVIEKNDDVVFLAKFKNPSDINLKIWIERNNAIKEHIRRKFEFSDIELLKPHVKTCVLKNMKKIYGEDIEKNIGKENGYVVFDLEATCWEKSVENQEKYKEVIEIEAVLLDSEFTEIDRKCIFIRPQVNQMLSDYCTNLTTITQDEVEKAPIFVEGIKEFSDWIRESEEKNSCSIYLVAWGNYDGNKLLEEMSTKNCVDRYLKELLEKKYINLKRVFKEVFAISDRKNVGLVAALEKMNSKADGTLHRGIDDAFNTGKLMRLVGKNKLLTKLYNNIDFIYPDRTEFLEMELKRVLRKIRDKEITNAIELKDELIEKKEKLLISELELEELKKQYENAEIENDYLIIRKGEASLSDTVKVFISPQNEKIGSIFNSVYEMIENGTARLSIKNRQAGIEFDVNQKEYELIKDFFEPNRGVLTEYPCFFPFQSNIAAMIKTDIDFDIIFSDYAYLYLKNIEKKNGVVSARGLYSSIITRGNRNYSLFDYEVLLRAIYSIKKKLNNEKSKYSAVKIEKEKLEKLIKEKDLYNNINYKEEYLFLQCKKEVLNINTEVKQNE